MRDRTLNDSRGFRAPVVIQTRKRMCASLLDRPPVRNVRLCNGFDRRRLIKSRFLCTVERKILKLGSSVRSDDPLPHCFRPSVYRSPTAFARTTIDQPYLSFYTLSTCFPVASLLPEIGPARGRLVERSGLFPGIPPVFLILNKCRSKLVPLSITMSIPLNNLNIQAQPIFVITNDSRSPESRSLASFRSDLPGAWLTHRDPRKESLIPMK